MRNSACIFVLCCYTVSIAQDPNNVYAANKNKDEGRWIWGVVEETTAKTENRNDNTQVNITTTTTLKPNEACYFPKPPTPDFSAPGKKISQERCEEHLWNNKVTKEINRKFIECTNELRKGIIPTAPAAVGGRPTFLGEFPHMGAIGWAAIAGGYFFKCGSTLISSKFVLTAAHCSKASSADTSLADVLPKVVRLNDKNLFQKDDKGYFVTEDVNISRIIVHPEYKPPKKYFDIALMELQYDVTFTYRIQPACLWTKDDLSSLGPEATLTGWGVLSAGSPNISPELQAAVVDIINNTYCDELLHRIRKRNWQGIKEHQLCAGKLAGGVDACQGDSGGPLQVKQIIDGQTVYQVIGITSFGIGCAAPNTPGIYTRVSSFVDWIEGYVWPRSK